MLSSLRVTANQFSATSALPSLGTPAQFYNCPPEPSNKVEPALFQTRSVQLPDHCALHLPQLLSVGHQAEPGILPVAQYW